MKSALQMCHAGGWVGGHLLPCTMYMCQVNMDCPGLTASDTDINVESDTRKETL